MPGPRGRAPTSRARLTPSKIFSASAPISTPARVGNAQSSSSMTTPSSAFRAGLDLEQPQLDRAVGAEQRAAREAEQQAVADLAGGAGDGDLEGTWSSRTTPCRRRGRVGSRPTLAARTPDAATAGSAGLACCAMTRRQPGRSAPLRRWRLAVGRRARRLRRGPPQLGPDRRRRARRSRRPARPRRLRRRRRQPVVPAGAGHRAGPTGRTRRRRRRDRSWSPSPTGPGWSQGVDDHRRPRRGDRRPRHGRRRTPFDWYAAGHAPATSGTSARTPRRTHGRTAAHRRLLGGRRRRRRGRPGDAGRAAGRRRLRAGAPRRASPRTGPRSSRSTSHACVAVRRRTTTPCRPRTPRRSSRDSVEHKYYARGVGVVVEEDVAGGSERRRAGAASGRTDRRGQRRGRVAPGRTGARLDEASRQVS